MPTFDTDNPSPSFLSETSNYRNTWPSSREPSRSWQSSSDVMNLMDQLTKHLRESQKEQVQFLENRKDKDTERLLKTIIEVKDKELCNAKRISTAWKDDVVAVTEQRYKSELEMAKKREEDGVLAVEKVREQLGNKEKEMRESEGRLESMERQKMKVQKEGDKEKERFGKDLLAKDREIIALQTGLGVKRQEIARLERDGDNLWKIFDGMEKERVELCKKVECEEKEKRELNELVAFQGREIQSLQRELTSKTKITNEMETKIKGFKSRVLKWKAHTTTLLRCLKEEEQKRWSKIPVCIVSLIPLHAFLIERRY